MTVRQASILLVGVILGVLVASLVWSVLGAHNVQAQDSTYFVDIVVVEGWTNDAAEFQIAHGVEGSKILGMTLAVHDVSGPWYTLDTSEGMYNNFWWNTLYIGGHLGQDRFADQPVRAVLFLGYPQE